MTWTGRTLFDKFERNWGKQKVRAKWGMQDLSGIYAEFDDLIAPYDDGTIDLAIAAAKQAMTWPPDVPEFGALLRRERSTHTPTKALPNERTEAQRQKDFLAAEKTIEVARRLLKNQRKPIVDIVPAPRGSTLATLQAGFEREDKKSQMGRGSLRWAYVVLLEYAGGDDKPWPRLRRAAEFAGINESDIEHLREEVRLGSQLPPENLSGPSQVQKDLAEQRKAKGWSA